MCSAACPADGARLLGAQAPQLAGDVFGLFTKTALLFPQLLDRGRSLLRFVGTQLLRLFAELFLVLAQSINLLFGLLHLADGRLEISLGPLRQPMVEFFQLVEELVLVGHGLADVIFRELPANIAHGRLGISPLE